jgi:hypothetical protein
MGMNDLHAVTARNAAIRLVVVASALLVAITAGALFVINEPQATVRTAASVQETSPLAASAAPVVATLASFICGSSNLTAPHPPATAFIDAVRTGSHAGYDRMTIQFSNGQPGSITLRPQATTSFLNSPRGDTVILSGRAGLQVVIRGADAHTSYSGPFDLKTRGPALVEVMRLEDFEGQVQWGLGLAKTACYRAFVLTGPTRLVIDVQVA